MISSINSRNILGIDSCDIKVEVDIGKGIPSFNIVGLASTEIKEARERVKSAISNSGYKFPNARIVINLSPADMKKQGSFLDLPISIGILNEKIYINKKDLEKTVFVGELSLDGRVKSIKGILPIVIGAKENKYQKVFIPEGNYCECSFIDGIEIIPIKSLKDCISIINGITKKSELEYRKSDLLKKEDLKKDIENDIDFSDIKGNMYLKRCAEISMAGGHNMLMIGPPGSGKSFIAKRMITILPDMTKEEKLEVSRIYSVSSEMNNRKGLIEKRPFRSPHHTTTNISLIGGGVDAKAGEITMADKGILFLDEIAEFNRKTLEALRQPIEDRKINISRLKYSITYPCDFILIAAMNPCPCGYYRSDTECRCRQHEIDRYLNKLSGPLLDRIDIFTEVKSISFKEMNSDVKCESSSEIKRRINIARNKQYERYKSNEKLNRDMNTSDIDKYCVVDENSKNILEMIFNKYKLSNRSYIKLLKVARTIADLDERKNIKEEDILEAFSMRKAYYTYFSKIYDI